MEAFTHRHTCTHTLNNAIEIKVVYVRIITSTPMQTTITMAFPAGEDDDRSLTVNGKAAVPVVLKRNRVDGAMGESVYVNTDCIRFSGSCLGFEIRVREACSALVVGAVGRKGDGRWVVQGREGGGGQETGVDGAMVDVYFVGRSMGRAVVLNRVVETRKTRKGLDCIPACDDEVATDDSEEPKKGIREEQSCDGVSSGYIKNGGEDELGELSWFSAGVRVGMGLGLAMCLGIGVGVGLVMRSYQAAAGTLRRKTHPGLLCLCEGVIRVSMVGHLSKVGRLQSSTILQTAVPSLTSLSLPLSPSLLSISSSFPATSSSSRYQMMGSKLCLQFAHPPLSFFLLFLLPSIVAVEQLQTYIVRMDADARPSVFPTQSHWYETVVLASALSTESSASSAPGGPLIHTYSSLFYGFSARLSPSAAAALASSPGVLAVLPELVRHPDTTRSPEFLGLLSSDRTGLLAESDFGSELVIAVVDTGITPGHRSFSDRGLGPAPARWRGECVSGPGFPASACNRKLVGARYFSGGYEATSGRMNESSELRSPRDTDGHGTHTASIAAGRYVFPASTLGYARGVAAGMAPKARLAAYKVCWAAGCFDSDILAAFDAAVADGVNVVSLSVGGVVVPYYLDAIAVGAFAAAEAGIFVSASAGNGGPGELTVTNVAPWVATVGAGSMDRDFPAYVKLGDGRVLPGVSVYGGPALSAGRLYPLVYAGAAQGAGDGYSSSLCLEGSLNPDTVKGRIVLCDRGVNSRAAKGEIVRKAGAVGMILANGMFDGEGLVADCHVLPAAAVGAIAGDEIREYIAAATLKSPATATILFRGTRLGVRPAPVVASFSARGPSPQSPEILKPDVIAPGLNILAAWPDNVGPAGIPSDQRKTEFNILSGTSMACPHVSGLAALLKAAHPDWSPAAIKSALMTTSYVKDNRGTTMLDESTGNSSDVFDYGSGHVHPQRAIDPGLVYDLTATDYVNFLCNLNYTQQNIKAITRRPADCRGARKAGHAGNLNYPSFSAVFVEDGAKRRMSTHFIRTVTNVGNGAAVYRAEVRAPEGSTVTVEPTELAFRRAGQKLSFLVRVKAATAEKLAPGSSKVRSGALTWSDGRHSVNSPIVVTVQAPSS
ncbi:unnamed protein product [Musa acuminata var. zebrina]